MTPDLRPAEPKAGYCIKDLKREIERTRLEWFNHNISYANGIACALSKIEKFETSVRERLESLEKMAKRGEYNDAVIAIELRRILGEEVKE